MIRMFALVLVVSVVGCSGSTGGIGGGNVPKEQYNSEVYKAICSHFATCGIAKSADTCFKYYQTLLGAYASVGTNFYDKAIELGKIKYDGAAAARCLSGYSNSACSLSALIVPAADCRSVYVGQVPVGSACGYGQCVPSAFCSSEVDAKCPGTSLRSAACMRPSASSSPSVAVTSCWSNALTGRKSRRATCADEW